MSRVLSPTEALILKLLAQTAQIDLGGFGDIAVNVVDEEYGSLRSAHLGEGERVKSRAECQFEDEDGVTVCVILLLDNSNRFGELVFWKGDGSPLEAVPKNSEAYHSFRKILPPA